MMVQIEHILSQMYRAILKQLWINNDWSTNKGFLRPNLTKQVEMATSKYIDFIKCGNRSRTQDAKKCFRSRTI